MWKRKYGNHLFASPRKVLEVGQMKPACNWRRSAASLLVGSFIASTSHLMEHFSNISFFFLTLNNGYVTTKNFQIATICLKFFIIFPLLFFELIFMALERIFEASFTSFNSKFFCLGRFFKVACSGF